MKFLTFALLFQCYFFSQFIASTFEQKVSFSNTQTEKLENNLKNLELLTVFSKSIKESSIQPTIFVNSNNILALLALLTLYCFGAKRSLALIVLFYSIPQVSSQGFITKFGGNSKNYYGSSIKPLSDGGFFVSGYAYEGSTYDMWTYRIDKQGFIVWSNVISCPLQSKVYSMDLTDDGGCIIAANRYIGCNGNSKAIFLARFSSSGSLIWQKDLSSLGNSIPQQIRKIGTESYIIAGSAPTSGIIIKISGSGDLGWSATYGTSNNEVLKAIVMLSDSKLVAVGSVSSPDATNK